MENIGAKLVRQAAAKTNDLAGDGTTTSVVLAQGLIAEGVKVSILTAGKGGHSQLQRRENTRDLHAKRNRESFRLPSRKIKCAALFPPLQARPKSHSLVHCTQERPTFIVLQVVAAGANPIQITRGIEKTIIALVNELKKLSKDVRISEARLMPNPNACCYALAVG